MSAARAMASVEFWRRLIAVFVMGVGGGLVLIGGWGLDIAGLRSLHPDFGNMKANAAVALITGGLALWLLAEDAPTLRRKLGRTAALLTAAIGGLTLAQYLFGVDLGIDQLLVADTVSHYGPPGRLAPNTALALLLLGLALLFLDRKTRRGGRPAEWLALGTGLIGFLGLLGYVYGAQPLYRVSSHYPMALHAALALLLLAFGVLLARPRVGLMAIVTSDSAGGYMARRLLPLALLAPPLLGWLRLLGERVGYYDPLYAVALFTTANVAVIAVLIWWVTRAHHELDLRHAASLAQMRTLSSAVEQTPDMVMICNHEGIIEYVNHAFEQVSGYRSEEAVGRFPNLVKSGKQPPSFYRELWRVVLRGEPFRAVFINRRKDGSLYHEQQTITPIKDRNGNITHFVSTGKDISEQVRQQAQLRESEERFRAAFEQAAVGIAHVGPDGSWLRVNQRLCDIVGYTREELLQKTLQDIVHPDDLDADLAHAREAPDGEFATHSTEKRYFRKNGSIVRINLTVSLVRDSSGTPAYFIFVIEDISERKRIEEALQQSETQWRAIFEVEPECVKVMKADGTLLQINPAGLAMIEADRAEQVVGRSVFGIVAPEYREEFQAFIERAIHGDRGNLEFEIMGLKGARRWLDTCAVPFRAPASGAEPLVLAVTRDISERKRAETELTRLAHYDDVTGLPNRLLFNDRLGQAMIDAKRRERLVGVALLDLDQFKKINDTLGHETGNALLQAVGTRLGAVLRPSDTVARLGGDEFAMVLADMAHVEDAAYVIQKIMRAFAQPFPVDGRKLFVTTSLGITFYPFDDIDARALLRNADIAMYRAKESGRNTCQFYAAEMTAQSQENMALESALHFAIERNELALHYQPIVNLRSGRIIALEALLRWQHPERGPIAPARFIPLAEESGLIIPIGEWVLNQACKQMRTWRDAGQASLRVAVNLSSRQFREPDLVERVAVILANAGLEGLRLELELTESMLLTNIEKTVGLMQRLDTAGVRFAVDDFGTGYSSLSYLKRFPIDMLKIDQSFVQDISTDTDDAAIVRAIITMAHSLGIQVVAEGVETAEQLRFLRANNCDAMQGYYFSKPQPADAISRLLMNGKTFSVRDRLLKSDLR